MDPQSERPLAARPAPGPTAIRSDALAAVALFLTSVLTMALTTMTGLYPQVPGPAASLALLALTVLPLALRRSRPWLCVALVALGFGLAGGVGVPEYLITQISLFTALYSEGAWDPDRRRAASVRGLVVAGMFVWLLVSLFRATTDPDVLDALPLDASGWSLSPLVAYMLVQLLTNVLYFGGAWWFGERAWTSACDRARLEDLARELSAQRRHAEQQAVALERVRIARELHDAVAHHVSLIGVQAGAARLALEARPDGARVAREALVRIEDASRSAVDDMHSILHALRRGGGDGPAGVLEAGADDAAHPIASLGVDRLPELAAESAATGVPTTFTEIGAPLAVPPLVSLNLYRVAQEALTNVRRHDGPGTTADVRLRHGEGWVELEIANTRPPRRLARPMSGPSGLGLVGMRERVESDGGRFEAGPLSSGGWVVRARVPLSRGAGS